MATILRQLPNNLYTSALGVVNFFPSVEGMPGRYGKGYRLGDVDSFTLQIEQTFRERQSKEHGKLTTVLREPSGQTANVTLTVMQLSDIVRAVSVMGSVGVMSQAAEPGIVKDFDTAEAGIYYLGHYAIENVTATKNSGEEAVLGEDYIYDAPSGQIELLRDFETFSITYDVPEISKGFTSGIGSTEGLKGMLVYRGTNDTGVRSMVVLRDVQLTPGGARSLIAAGEDFEGIELSGIASPVSGVPGLVPGTEIGWEQDIPEADDLMGGA